MRLYVPLNNNQVTQPLNSNNWDGVIIMSLISHCMVHSFRRFYRENFILSIYRPQLNCLPQKHSSHLSNHTNFSCTQTMRKKVHDIYSKIYWNDERHDAANTCILNFDILLRISLRSFSLRSNFVFQIERAIETAVSLYHCYLLFRSLHHKIE